MLGNMAPDYVVMAFLGKRLRVLDQRLLPHEVTHREYADHREAAAAIRDMVVRAAHEAGKRIHVYVDETRPRLQGARLTTWELGKLGVPHTLVADGAAGHLMRTRGVDLCLVGADRIAANGDTANKIGTYTLAL